MYGQIAYNIVEDIGSCGQGFVSQAWGPRAGEWTYRCQQVFLQVEVVQAVP